MENVGSLSHTLWECKYHLVWIPKCRKKTLYGQLRKYLVSLCKDLASQRECEIIEGHLLPGHVHILISIPPNYAVAQVVGFIKGKSAIHIERASDLHPAFEREDGGYPRPDPGIYSKIFHKVQ